jgi:hypothetical protein
MSYGTSKWGTSKHVPGVCECVRCRGIPSGEWEKRNRAEPGNELRLSHGAYRGDAVLAGDERTLALVEEIRGSAPVVTAADEVQIRLLAVTLRRVEAAVAAVERVDALSRDPAAPYVVDDALALARLREDLRAWINTARKLASDLGMTPASRARLGLDIASTQRALSVVEFYRAKQLDADDEDSAA